ncbi:MAG: OmpA/MotB family protein, partial [Pyrinomonadaceae bacterium]
LWEARAAVERAFAANESLRARARVTSNERGLVVSLAEAGFFAPGEATLRDDANALIDSLADALRDTRAPLRVEGHTDSQPISTLRYPSNWELSAARSAAVLARLTARGLLQTRLSIAGYAGEQPVADNSTPEGRALNRRVDLVVVRDH